MDYSNFYASAAQVIPVLVLIYVVEGSGFRRFRRISFPYVLLFLSLSGESAAMIALSFGSPATDKWVLPVIFGTLGSIFLAGFGVANIISDQRKQASDGSTSE